MAHWGVDIFFLVLLEIMIAYVCAIKILQRTLKKLKKKSTNNFCAANIHPGRAAALSTEKIFMAKKYSRKKSIRNLTRMKKLDPTKI